MSLLSSHNNDVDRKSLRQQAESLGNSAGDKILWIACTDVVMDQAIERLRSVMPALVLRRFAGDVPDHDCSDYDEFAAAHYAVEQLGVRDIVICGHSMCSGIAVEQWEVSGREQLIGSDLLLHRSRMREARNERSRENVIRQLGELHACPWVTELVGNGDLAVHGAFYLAESGTFTRYDYSSGKFRVIASGESK